MKTTIEIVGFDNGEVVEEIDVSGRNENYVDRCEAGMNINLNHEEYFTRRTTKERSNA
jgi:hypothetical protein